MKTIVSLLLAICVFISNYTMEENSHRLTRFKASNAGEPVSRDIANAMILQPSVQKQKKKRTSKKSELVNTIEPANESSKQTELLDLPDEVLLLIMSYVGDNDRRQTIKQFKEIEVVSKKFQALVNDAKMFPACLQEFKNLYPIQAQTLAIKEKITKGKMSRARKEKNDEDYIGAIVSQGDVESLKAFIADGGNVQERTSGTKLSPVILAVGNGHKEAAELLISANALDCEEKNRALLTAIILGNMKNTKALLNEELPVELADKRKRTALLYAAAGGNEDLVRLLIERNANTNAADDSGVTPLMLAAHFGHKNIVDILIENHANVNARTYQQRSSGGNAPDTTPISDDGDNTALMFALRNKNNEVKDVKEIIENLMSNGADVNAINKLGISVLAFAVRFGKEIVAYLIDHGASVEQTSSISTYTPLTVAVMAGYPEIIELLISRGADVNAKIFQRADFHEQTLDNTDTPFLTPLLAAAQFGIIESAKVLLDHGADINVKGAEGVTSLMFAAAFGYIPLADLLLQHGAHINETNKNNCNALTCAALGGHSRMIEFLVEHGAQFATEDKAVPMALMKAAREENQELVERLLSIGAPINLDNQYALLRFAIETKNKAVLEKAVSKENVNSKADGVPLLHIAACNNKKEILEFLINKGADVNILCDLGQTALMHSARKGRQEHVNLLIAKGADIHAKVPELDITVLMNAAEGGNPEIVRQVVHAGVEVNLEDFNGQTALMMTAKKGSTAIVEIILEAGALINTQDRNGMTALMHAAGTGNKNVVILLMKKGADIAIKDKHNKTAFAYAAQNGHTSIVEYILDTVADLSNEEIMIAIETALQQSHTEIADLLKKKINK